MQEIKEARDLIVKQFDAFQRHSNALIRFETSLPTEENLIFGAKLTIDLLFSDDKAFLLLVNKATPFSGASFFNPACAYHGKFVEGY